MPPEKWKRLFLKTELILFATLFCLSCTSVTNVPPKAKITPVKKYIVFNRGGSPARTKTFTITQEMKPADAIPTRTFVITDLPVRSTVPAKTDLPGRSVFSPKILKEKIYAAKIIKVQNPKTLTIYFGFDSFSISENELLKLNKFIKKINQPVQIDGYASQSGSSRYNQRLSFKRALAVKKYIKDHSVQVLSATGRGEIEKPQPKLSRKVVISTN